MDTTDNSATLEALESPELQNLDFSAFSRDDLSNIVLQRSGVLWDVPRYGRVIRSWRSGDSALIYEQIDRLGHEIARRAAALIYTEFQEISPLLDKLRPKRIADIGCGYSFWGLFAARSFGAELILVDTEANEHRHFGLSDVGAAYASLTVARRFLTDNGIPDARITTINPATQEVQKHPADLTVSFLSCGFHYPVSTYLDYFRGNAAQGGKIILDIRESAGPKQLEALEAVGKVETLGSRAKSRRIMVSPR